MAFFILRSNLFLLTQSELYTELKWHTFTWCHGNKLVDRFLKRSGKSLLKFYLLLSNHQVAPKFQLQLSCSNKFDSQGVLISNAAALYKIPLCMPCVAVRIYRLGLIPGCSLKGINNLMHLRQVLFCTLRHIIWVVTVVEPQAPFYWRMVRWMWGVEDGLIERTWWLMSCRSILPSAPSCFTVFWIIKKICWSSQAYYGRENFVFLFIPVSSNLQELWHLKVFSSFSVVMGEFGSHH